MYGGMEQRPSSYRARTGKPLDVLDDLLWFSAASDQDNRTRIWLLLSHLAPGASQSLIEACASAISSEESWNDICKSASAELGSSAELVLTYYHVAKSKSIAQELIHFIESDRPWVVEFVLGGVRTKNGFSYWSSKGEKLTVAGQALLLRCDDPLGDCIQTDIASRDAPLIEIRCLDLDRVAAPSDMIMPNLLVLTHCS